MLSQGSGVFDGSQFSQSQYDDLLGSAGASQDSFIGASQY
jgi:hypothetical protein